MSVDMALVLHVRMLLGLIQLLPLLCPCLNVNEPYAAELVFGAAELVFGAPSSAFPKLPSSLPAPLVARYMHQGSQKQSQAFPVLGGRNVAKLRPMSGPWLS